MQPSERTVRIAGALILAAGLAASGLALLAAELGVGPEISRARFGWKRISLLAAGVVVITLGAVLLAPAQVLSRRVDSERVAGGLKHLSERYPAYLAIGLLGLLGIVLVWTRLMTISASLWHDEAVSATTFDSLGAVLDNPAAHVLYNLLSAGTTSLLGESEAMHRFWSVMPGIAAIGFAAWWAWKRLGPVAAVAFAALAVAAPLHLEHAPEARGYGLALLAATLMLIAADQLTRSYSRWTLLGFLGAGLVGIWTLIFFAFSFVGQALSLLRWPKLRLPVVAVVAVAGLLSLGLYAPVVTPFFFGSEGSGAAPEAWNQAIAGDEFISLREALLLESSLEWLAIPAATPLIGGSTWAATGGLALVAVAIAALWQRREAGLALILVLPPVLFNLGFTIGGFSTVERHQLLLLPHVLLLIAIGIAALAGIVARFRVLRPIAIAGGVVAVLALSKATMEAGQTRALPRENFKEVANVVRWTGINRVVTDSERPQGLIYYLGDVLAVLPPEEIESMLCGGQRRLIYIRHIPRPHDGVAPLDCLIGANAVRVRIAQRSRGAYIDVWIVEPEAAGRR